MTAPVAYLDWNATAPLRGSAREALLSGLAQLGNPSSVHGCGRAARRLVEAARADVAALVNAATEFVTFTGGGTEANNLALCGTPLPVAVSAVEHASVLAARSDAIELSVDGDGILRLDELERVLAQHGPMLVSVMLANNETGVLQPVADIAALVHGRGGYLHCDAVQAAGRVTIDIEALAADWLTLSAHKIGGPQGVGALVARGDDPMMRPILRGGGQESGRRAGTENVAGIAGFGAAARDAAREVETGAAMAAQRDRLESEALRAAPATTVIAGATARLPNTTCLSLPGAEAATIVMAMDLAGVAVSAGSACSSGKVRASHVLRAMGVPAVRAGGAIRVSLGRSTTEAEIDRFVAVWGALAARLGSNRVAA